MWVYSSGSVWNKLEARERERDDLRYRSIGIPHKTRIVDHFTKLFDSYIIIGDFNQEPSNTILKYLPESNGFYNLFKGNTWGKGFLIDLILTNRKFSFKNTQWFETGLGGHHHMVYTIIKTSFQKSEPKQLICG